jgi:hypothetical protein
MLDVSALRADRYRIAIADRVVAATSVESAGQGMLMTWPTSM